ncbi:hypothetical protein K502DRAFT_340630 [Neoconidiobolus thromboides FSU 785]|nr:hypothetical protein K502DRAFT_340630 [Neoconidiobolus thromboides FSU 785]
MKFSINGLNECSCKLSDEKCKDNNNKVSDINAKDLNDQPIFPYTRPKSNVTRLRASYWSEFLTSNNRTERRLFLCLKSFILAQTAINLALFIINLVKQTYISSIVIAILFIPKTIFGTLSSNSNGRKYLGILAFLIILWESWTAFHVTLLVYQSRDEALKILVDGVIEDKPLLISILLLYGIHLIFSVILISLVLIWYLSPAFNNSSWDLNPSAFNSRETERESEKLNKLKLASTTTPKSVIDTNDNGNNIYLKPNMDIETNINKTSEKMRPESDVPTILLDQRLNLLNPKSLEASPLNSNLKDLANNIDPYLNNLKYQIKLQLLKRYSEPFEKGLDSDIKNSRWSANPGEFNKEEFEHS